VLKRAIKRLFSALGYGIVRQDDFARIDNFVNLVGAYEQLLNESRGQKLVGSDENRPKLLARLLGTPPSEAY